MEYRTLGGTGLRVSVLGLGAAGLGNLYESLTDAEGAAVARQALDGGITYVDTAPLYGEGASERRIGQALRGHPLGPGCIVATKVGFVPPEFDYSADATRRSVEDSLRRLDRDVLPLVQIHEIDPQNWSRVFAPRGALVALRRLQEEGDVGHVGVTGSHLPTLARAVATGEFATVLLWRHYHLLDTAGRAVIDAAAARGMGVVVGTPFAGGLLASGDRPEARHFYAPAGAEERGRVRAVEQVCARHGVPLAAVALRFCARAPGVTAVIAGADSPAHVQDNVRLMDVAIPQGLWDDLT